MVYETRAGMFKKSRQSTVNQHVLGVYILAIKTILWHCVIAANNMISVAAICILVSAEVFISSVNYERQNLPARHPEGAYIIYGYSFGLVWVVLVICVVVAIINFYYGKKRKGDRALSDKEATENEPVHLGRY